MIRRTAVERESTTHALEIEAQAKRRLADEYDVAQERGEVIGPKGGGSTVPNGNGKGTAARGSPLITPILE
jgi:hypothetical protein